jgi:hypothetical protein
MQFAINSPTGSNRRRGRDPFYPAEIHLTHNSGNTGSVVGLTRMLAWESAVPDLAQASQDAENKMNTHRIRLFSTGSREKR